MPIGLAITNKPLQLRNQSRKLKKSRLSIRLRRHLKASTPLSTIENPSNTQLNILPKSTTPADPTRNPKSLQSLQPSENSLLYSNEAPPSKTILPRTFTKAL